MKKKIGNIRRILGICIVIVSAILLISIITRNINSNIDKVVPIDEIIGKTANRKFIKIKDINGDIFYLPKGFKISDNTSEQTVDNGLVIIDNTGDKETDGSEFVWIPVDNSNTQEFEEKFTNNIGNTYKTIDFNLLKENTETEEYVRMKNSVYTYGGFFVARYEAGISDKMQEALMENNFIDKQFISKDTTEEFANGDYKPISKVDSLVWNYIQWGGDFESKATDGFSGNDKLNGVVKVARSMYEKNSKTSVKSSLCYGSQWEAIMNFIDENYYNNSCDENSIIINSNDTGNYYNELQKTGSDIKFFQKNISDLAGNAWELTMESYNELYRVARGGAYSSKGDAHTISSSKEVYPSDYSKEIGFRVVLWMD